jgi:hypothetical protein
MNIPIAGQPADHRKFRWRHGRPHAKLSRFIGGGPYNGSSAPPGNDKRFAEDLYCRAVRPTRRSVHIDVHDLPRNFILARVFGRLHLVLISGIGASVSSSQTPPRPVLIACSRACPPPRPAL